MILFWEDRSIPATKLSKNNQNINAVYSKHNCFLIKFFCTPVNALHRLNLDS